MSLLDNIREGIRVNNLRQVRTTNNGCFSFVKEVLNT